MSAEKVYKCQKGHIKPKAGWCAQCGKARYDAIAADPIASAVHKARKRREEATRYEASQEYRDRKNAREWVRKNFPAANVSERERLFVERLDAVKASRKPETPKPVNHAVEKLKVRADYMAKQARYGIIVKEIPL